jgi:hypothetical protein
MQTVEYAARLSSIIDAQVYTSLVMSLGDQLNDRKDRFDKADIIEQTVESASDDKLKWLDGIGRDHRDTETGIDIEFKYMSNGLFTRAGKPKSVVKVKLKNSLGKNKGVTINNPANFYMIGQQNSIAIISWDEIEEFLVGVPDGIEAHIPFEKLSFVFTPTDVNENTLIKVNYKEVKRQVQKDLIESVKKIVKNC